MPRVIVTEGAVRGLTRCRQSLEHKSPDAARRAGRAIASALARLETVPHLGRPVDRSPALRELGVPYGESGYVALYLFEPASDTVYVLAVRHAREAGYSDPSRL